MDAIVGIAVVAIVLSLVSRSEILESRPAELR